MSYFTAKMHQIRFRLPRPRWGSLQRSPRPLAVFKGPTSKGSGGGGTVVERKGWDWRGGERRGEEWRERRVPKVTPPLKNPRSANVAIISQDKTTKSAK